jgi:anaphase-promoting complex subunit 11
VAEGAEFPGDDSPVVWGDCQHAFHLRCLQQWLSTNNSCPICRRDWNFASDENEGEKNEAGAGEKSDELAAAAQEPPDSPAL